MEKKERTDVKWETIKGSLIVGQFGDQKPSDSICGFDMDSTLTLTKGKNLFMKNGDDWKWWDPSVPKKLKEEFEKDKRIVIMSNQGGIGSGHGSERELKKKMIQMFDELKIPFIFLAGTQDDQYGKPSKGMWTYFMSNMNEETKVDMEKSFYCGDAAGRPATKDGKKDFSDTDRIYAVNTGLKFYTPEQYFLGETEEIAGDTDLRTYQKNEGKPVFEDSKALVESDEQEVIIFVGSPGSGKSTFWQNHLKKYVRVNNDTLKTAEKCQAALREALKAKKSAVIDNTNKTKEEGNRYISIAK